VRATSRWVLAAAALLAPSLIWSLLDRGVWTWDPALYARLAVELWNSLAQRPLQWPAHGLWITHRQPPGIAWLGQLFVPIGAALGGVDRGLHVLILLAQGSSLVSVARAVRHLGGTAAQAALGMLALASAPLFIGMSHQFFVEPLQCAAVAWALAAAAAAPHRSRERTALELTAACAAAMLTKATSPLYLAAPMVWAIWRARAAPREGRLPRAGSLVTGALVAAATIWYLRHLPAAWGHLVGGTGEVARLFGAGQSPLDSLLWWLGAAQRSAALPGVALLVGVLSLPGLRRLPRATRTLFGLGAIEAAIVIGLLVSHHNREPRFLLPLLPLLGIGLALSVRGRPMAVVGAALGLQLGMVHAVALGQGDWRSGLSHWVIPLDAAGRDHAGAAAALEVVCDGGRGLVIAELPWLNVSSLRYLRAKQSLAGAPACQLDWLEGYDAERIAAGAEDITAGRTSRVLLATAIEHPAPPQREALAAAAELAPILAAQCAELPAPSGVPGRLFDCGSAPVQR